MLHHDHFCVYQLYTPLQFLLPVFMFHYCFVLFYSTNSFNFLLLFYNLVIMKCYECADTNVSVSYPDI